jgi:hypothetical protein
MLRTRPPLLALVSAWALWSASAAVLIPRTFGELVAGADRIIIGTCVRATAFWDDRLIFTRYELAVEETLKGEPDPRAEFVSPGGQVGEVRMEGSESPSVRPGERVLVFLARNPSGRMRVFGAAQGKYELERDAGGLWHARTGLVAITAPETAAVGREIARVASGSRLPLDTLRGAIRAWIAQGRSR